MFGWLKNAVATVARVARDAADAVVSAVSDTPESDASESASDALREAANQAEAASRVNRDTGDTAQSARDAYRARMYKLVAARLYDIPAPDETEGSSSEGDQAPESSAPIDDIPAHGGESQASRDEESHAPESSEPDEESDEDYQDDIDWTIEGERVYDGFDDKGGLLHNEIRIGGFLFDIIEKVTELSQSPGLGRLRIEWRAIGFDSDGYLRSIALPDPIDSPKAFAARLEWLSQYVSRLSVIASEFFGYRDMD